MKCSSIVKGSKLHADTVGFVITFKHGKEWPKKQRNSHVLEVCPNCRHPTYHIGIQAFPLPMEYHLPFTEHKDPIVTHLQSFFVGLKFRMKENCNSKHPAYIFSKMFPFNLCWTKLENYIGPSGKTSLEKKTPWLQTLPTHTEAVSACTVLRHN